MDQYNNRVNLRVFNISFDPVKNEVVKQKPIVDTFFLIGYKGDKFLETGMILSDEYIKYFTDEQI